MTKFFLKLFLGFTILVLMNQLLLQAEPHIATFLALAIAVITGIALIRRRGLGRLGRGFTWFLFLGPGLFILALGLVDMQEAHEQRLATLKLSDPTAYLEAIEHSDPDKWYRELRRIDPDRYEVERQRRLSLQRAKRAAEKQARDEKQRSECGSAYATNAYIYTQSFVETRLKSPATADFPSIHKDGIQSKAVGDCVFEIIAYVDAQNGFGTMLRTHYVARIKRQPDSDSWQLLGLEFLQ